MLSECSQLVRDFARLTSDEVKLVVTIEQVLGKGRCVQQTLQCRTQVASIAQIFEPDNSSLVIVRLVGARQRLLEPLQNC